MPVEIAAISPAPNGAIANGDLFGSERTNISLPTFPATSNFRVGKVAGGKALDDYFALLLRFEIQVQQGSIINALRVNLWGNSDVDGTMTLMKGGFIKPQTVDGTEWQHADGVANWLTASDVPYAEIDRTLGPDFIINDDVFWGDLPAFQNQPFTTQPTARTTWSIGDGIAGFNNVTGLVAQLQAYIDDDDNELLRGTGNDLGGLPVCFQLLHSEDQGSGGRQGGIMSDIVGFPLLLPTLEINWSPADQGVRFPVSVSTPSIVAKRELLATVIKNSSQSQAVSVGTNGVIIKRNPAILEVLNSDTSANVPQEED